ncbi:MAG: hypothetical protein SGI72_11605 [Planctomycetota bacterium]|nr:hypothetical protein [Planctomycetota bacterium]
MHNNEIQQLIQSFTAQIEAAAKRAALEQVIATLGGIAPAAKRGPGRPKGSTVAGKASGRSTQDVGQMGEVLLDFVRANPGQRSDQIAKALGTTPDLMRKPMTALLESKKVKKRGIQRGTTYFVA